MSRILTATCDGGRSEARRTSESGCRRQCSITRSNGVPRCASASPVLAAIVRKAPEGGLAESLLLLKLFLRIRFRILLRPRLRLFLALREQSRTVDVDLLRVLLA